MEMGRVEQPSRWERLRRPVRAVLRGLLLLVALYMVVGFTATRTTRDAVEFSTVGVEWGGADPGPAGSEGERGLRGAISVHTGRSHDAEGTLDEVGRAAAAAGLDFVILGDHVGEWAEGGPALLEPQWNQGVLLVPGLELVVKDAGRVLAVGLDTLPREWLGTVDELVAEVREAGGFLSVVHPRSPRARERWAGLSQPGIDAWESFDISEMARLRQDEPLVGYRIAGLLATMTTGRGHKSLARFWKEGTATPALLAYDSARARGPVVLTGGLNHHPKARILGRLVPAYTPFFRTVVNHVRVDGPRESDPVRARARLLHALRSGHLFVTLEDAEEVQDFDLWARNGAGVTASMGGQMPWDPSTVLRVSLPPAVARAPVRILRDGVEVTWLEGRGGEVVGWSVPGPGRYRVEVFRPGWRVGRLRFGFRPWIVSNPVELRDPAAGEG
jgi:hypothetical protein